MNLWPWAAAPFLLQGALMLVDEGFHFKRGLPAWERWGHPVDAFATAACYAFALAAPAAPGAFAAYAAAAVIACLCVSKDEWVHAKLCTGPEQWLHACLFMLHPVLLALAGWWAFGGIAKGAEAAMGERAGHAAFGIFLAVQAGLTAAFGLWQAAYWNGPWGRAPEMRARADARSGGRP